MSEPFSDQDETLALWAEAGGIAAAGWDAIHRAGIYSPGAGASPMEPIENLGIKAIVHGEPRRIMEVGVGAGNLIRYLAGRGHQVTAVDISPAALAGLPGDIDTFLVSELNRTPPPAQADIIISYQTFQHVADLGSLIAALFRVLAPGGLMAFQYASAREGVPLEPWAARDVEAGFLHLRAAAEIRSMVAAFDGTIIAEHFMDPVPSIRWGLVKAERCQAG